MVFNRQMSWSGGSKAASLTFIQMAGTSVRTAGSLGSDCPQTSIYNWIPQHSSSLGGQTCL